MVSCGRGHETVLILMRHVVLLVVSNFGVQDQVEPVQMNQEGCRIKSPSRCLMTIAVECHQE